jgi:hypothetical protein
MSTCHQLWVGLFLTASLISSQATVYADDAATQHLLYFDEPVGFSTFHNLTVYREWDNAKSFILLPTGVKTASSGISFHYKKTHGRFSGTMELTVRPTFDEEEFNSVINELKISVPDGRFVLGEPVMSEWEIIGRGVNETVTPPLMSNPLLTDTSVSINIPDELSRILLHSGSNYASAFVVRHKFAMRGVEIDDAMSPHVTTRWFSRSVSFTGGCSVEPERYVDLENGRAGCLFEITFDREFVKEIQSLLRQLGLYHDGIDGTVGTLTRSAIRSFQSSHGMANDGELSSILMLRLREEAETRR